MSIDLARLTVPGASAELFQLQEGVYALRSLSGFDVAGGPLVDAAVTAVTGMGGRALHLRVDGATAGHDVAETLRSRGFARVSERLEYEAEVARLPDDGGSPLTWTSPADLDDTSLRAAAAVLEAAGQGDPDWFEDDDAFELLKSYLAEPALSGGPDAIAIGHVGGETAAIVIAQASPATGIGRLTYLGVLPRYRQRGLGAWVHRRGFAMLAALGATTYRGGTLVQNHAMQRLFVRHGCREWRRLEEWVWRAPAQGV